MIRETSSSNPGFKKENCGVVQDGFHIASIEIEIIYGYYLMWPSFRDLFTAVYIKYIRLRKLQKLFRLKLLEKQKKLFQRLH